VPSNFGAVLSDRLPGSNFERELPKALREVLRHKERHRAKAARLPIFAHQRALAREILQQFRPTEGVSLVFTPPMPMLVSAALVRVVHAS
jgi:hypothetical protein